MDYQGPYATKAIGGFNGKFTFVEWSVGYGVVFLVKSKSEAYSCVLKINTLCLRFGYDFQVLRTDAGSVENSAQFIEQCAILNGLGKSGIQIMPASVEMQRQNPVERYIQTADNMATALLVDQDLLPGCFWGYANIAVWQAWNAVSNTLCPMSTPLYEFEHKVTNVSKMFKNPWGQAVICTRVGKRENDHETTRTELGVVVCSGNTANGSEMIYFPERGTRLVTPRYHVRPINLGSHKQMSLQDGRQYMPVFGKDGSWHIVTRGDTSFLARQFLIEADDVQLQQPNMNLHYTKGEGLLTSLFDSSIAADEILEEIERTRVMNKVQESLSEEFASVEIHPSTGRLVTTDVDGKVKLLDNHEDSISDRSDIIGDYVDSPRHSTRAGAGTTTWLNDYQRPVINMIQSVLLLIGAAIIMCAKSPDVKPIMAYNVGVSNTEYLRRHPTWGQAMKVSDKEK